MSAGSGGPSSSSSESAVSGAASGAGTGARFERLVAVMDRLRSPGGCAWDGRQSHESLLKYLIEEAYEVVEAVESPGGPPEHREDLVEELGDVLLQVVFHARVAQERGSADGGFGIDEVVEAITAKLIRRHPQVFGAGGDDESSAEGSAAASAPSDAQLHRRWEDLKRAEKPQRTGPFDGVPPGLPALQRTEKILSKARRHGLEPSSPRAQDGSAAPIADEEQLGAALFELVRAASAQGLDAEAALRRHSARWAREREQEQAARRDRPGAPG